MDRSNIKGMKLSGCDAAKAKTKRREIGRIIATGYDTKLPHDDVESTLRKHFGSCGEITDVYIGEWDNILDNDAFIYFLGEGAVDKALQLSGSDVGGWNVVAEPYPFSETQARWPEVVVTGHDTSLSDVDIESALRKHFSLCGEIDKVVIYDESFERVATVSVRGEDAEDKVLELDGSLMGGRKLVVELLNRPAKYSVHSRRRLSYGGGRCGGCNPPGKKKAKMTA